ncbi:MAG: hypothetical protein QM784_30870 [Polyangiaceae bacterium]
MANLGRRRYLGFVQFRSTLTLLSVLFALPCVGGCSKKSKESPKAGALGAAAVSAAASSAAPVDPLRTAVPRFAVVSEFPNDATTFRLKNGLVICDACSVDTKRRKEPRPLHAYDGTTLTDLTSLLDDNKIAAALSATSVAALVEPSHGGAYRFLGKWPESLYVELFGEWDDDNTPRNGSVWIRRTLKRAGNTSREIPEESVYDEKLERFDQEPGPPRDLPRQFDAALVHAPHWGNGEIPVVGGDGPLLVLGAKVLDLWDEHVFRQLTPSWTGSETIDSVARLATGYTLVATSTGLYVVGRDGKSQPLEWSGGDVPSKPHLFVIQNHLAMLGVVGAKMRLYRFENNEPLAVPHHGRKTNQATENRTAPPKDAESIPAMVKFTSACKHPFVVLFTPPGANWDYRSLAANLTGQGDLQDHLTFVEFLRGETVYFGAQADTEDLARALIGAYVGRVPKAKPQLGCLDAKGYLPDPTTDKWDARTVSINLAVGSAL